MAPRTDRPAPDLVAGKVATTVEQAGQLSEGADEALADAVALAAVDGLATRLGPGARIGAIGFSFGAAWSIWCAAKRVAASDPYKTDEGVAAFKEALRAAGRAVTIQRYPDTGHWFAEPSREAYRPEAADLAFSRTVDFLRNRLGSDG